MAKIILYTDVHWCTYSSIVRKRGKKYSVRLEHLIDSMNFVQEVAKRYNAIATYCLGDFFDKPDLTSEELTALRDIKWSTDCKHYFIVGNHESEQSDLIYNSSKALETLDKDRFKVVSNICSQEVDNLKLVMIPYITEKNRKPIEDYLDTKDIEHTVILSHNDIKGIQYGKYQSKEGFELQNILDNCRLFINGHLHNSSYLDKDCKVLNLGNLCGMNFNENALEFPHFVGILDTETFELTFEENPYALNFYSVDASELQTYGMDFRNAIVQLMCWDYQADMAKEVLKNNPNVLEYRIVVKRSENTSTNIDNSTELKVDKYLDKFVECISEKLESSDMLKEELGEIVK